MQPLLFFIAICSSFWTTGIQLRRGNYVANISQDTLNSVMLVTSRPEPDGTVHLSGLKLKIIEKHVFHHLPNVTALDLANNELEQLPPLIFEKLTSLESLSLANNKIRTFEEYFVGLDNLKLLNLSNNLISSLTKADLRGLPKSADIIMEGNLLKTITVDSSDDPSQPHYMPPKPNNIYADPWSDLKVYDGELEAFRNFISKHTSYWSSLDLRTINLANHNISELTPEMFNDLPKFITIGNLQNNHIKVVKKHVIRNKFLRKLYLDYNAINRIEVDAFEKTRLFSISIRHNCLKNLDFARTLPTSIRELSLEGNVISNISDDALTHLTKLKHLIIPSNRIVHLSVRAFRGLHGLRLLDLSNNLLEIIEPGSFKHQRKLSILKLSGNKIKRLNPGIFEGLKKLHKLELRSNAIKEISRGSFVGLKKSLIYELILSSNEIDTIEEGSFANMTIELLLLNDNKISETSIAKGAFESCTLYWLSLKANSFARINGESFYGILVYKQISLMSNDIKSINRNALKYMGGVQSLDLRDNPVERIENGSLFGFRRGSSAKIIINRVKVIEGGAFDDA